MSMQTRRHKRSSTRAAESPETEVKVKKSRESDKSDNGGGSGREEGELPPEPAQHPDPEAELDALLGKCISIYKHFMDKRQRNAVYLIEDIMLEVHASGEKQALDYFRKQAAKFKEEETVAQTEEILKLQIVKLYEEAKTTQDAKRQKCINDAMSEAMADFRTRLESAVSLTKDNPTDFYEEDYIKTSAQEANSLVMEEVKWNLPNEKEEKIEYVKKTLKEQLDDVLNQTLQKNQEHRSNCETALFNCIDDCQKQFKTRLSKIMSEESEASTAEITEKAETLKQECIKSYQDKSKPGTPEMHEKYFTKLVENIGVDCEFLINTHNILLEQRNNSYRDAIAKNSTELRTYLMENFDSQLSEVYKNKSEELILDFKNRINPYPNRPAQRDHWIGSHFAVLKKVYEDFLDQIKSLIPLESNIEETIKINKKRISFGMHKILRICQRDYIDRIECIINQLGVGVDMEKLMPHHVTTLNAAFQLLEHEAKIEERTEVQVTEMKAQLTQFADYYMQSLKFQFCS